MLLLQKLSKLFLVAFFLVSGEAFSSETKWEVAIVFRGEDDHSVSDSQFQKDIDDNVLELSRINPKASLKIGIYRELEGRSYTYSGTLIKNKTTDLGGFLKKFYKDSTSKKALIIYSHGLGPNGLLGLTTKDLKQTLVSIPHLDFLWLDACFMANVEFLYELRAASDFTISSEEAEFSSGLPFQALSDLPKFTNANEATIALAKSFIESYSYLKKGSQRKYVSSSAATISVIENKKLEQLASSLKWVSSLYKKLSREEKNKLSKILGKKAVMDESSLVDLGMFLIEFRKIIPAGTVDSKLTTLIRVLNIESIKKLKTNPRIHIMPPKNAESIVYGFNNWKAGSKKDFTDNANYSSIYKNDAFISGPNNKDWPIKDKIPSDIVLTPFAPGINSFNYYFLDKAGKVLTEALSVARTHDVVESSAYTDASPILYSAYTQAIGSFAERYTGLNISMPGSIPSLDYFELEFNQLAEWLSL